MRTTLGPQPLSALCWDLLFSVQTGTGTTMISALTDFVAELRLWDGTGHLGSPGT